MNSPDVCAVFATGGQFVYVTGKRYLQMTRILFEHGFLVLHWVALIILKNPRIEESAIWMSFIAYFLQWSHNIVRLPS